MNALVAAGANVNAKDKDGITPLMSAASSYPRWRDSRAAREGRERQRDEQRRRHRADRGGLRRACAGRRRAARRRRGHGALRDCAGRTALMASALGGNAAVTALLLSGRPIPEQLEDENGMNALVYAASPPATMRSWPCCRRPASRRALTWRWRLRCAPAVCRWRRRCSSGASLKTHLNGDHLLLLAAGSLEPPRWWNCSSAVEGTGREPRERRAPPH